MKEIKLFKINICTSEFSLTGQYNLFETFMCQSKKLISAVTELVLEWHKTVHIYTHFKFISLLTVTWANTVSNRSLPTEV